MQDKKNALQFALEQGLLPTRPLAEIEQDQEETIRWAEEVARGFPVKVRRGRPRSSEPSGPSRSVTVRFPELEAKLILASAERQGLTLSEFVRAAAFHAASLKAKQGTRPAAQATPKPAKTVSKRIP